MTIPGPFDIQTPLSRFGEEQFPTSIVLKSTMWTLFLKNNSVFIREYNGQRLSPDLIYNSIEFYTITNALDISGIIIDTKLWLWTIENGNLYFTEVEPFIDKSPNLGIKSLVESNISSINFNVTNGNVIKGLVIDKQIQDFGKSVTYNDYTIPGQPSSIKLTLNWPGTRLNDISILVEQDSPNKFLIAYLDTSSPPNVNLEEITESPIGTDYEILDNSIIGTGAIVTTSNVVNDYLSNSEIISATRINSIINVDYLINGEISGDARIQYPTPTFIINVIPTNGFIGDEIIISSAGFFDSLSVNNFVYFGNIIADDVTVVNISTLRVIVPNGAASDYIHVQTNNSISNYVFFEIPYPDEHFKSKTKTKGKFDNGPGKTPIYNRDIGITNFTETVDENSIVQNIYNILLTRPGERLFNPNFGCPIHDKVFDLIDSVDITEKEVLNIIDDSLLAFEPRAILLKDQSFVNFREDDNALDVLLVIRIPSGIIKEIAISIGKGFKSA